MARVDPWLRSWKRSALLAEDLLLELEVERGELRAFQGQQQVELCLGSCFKSGSLR